MSVEVDTLELEVFEVSPQTPLEDATNGSRARVRATPRVKRGDPSREEMRNNPRRIRLSPSSRASA